MSMFPLEKATKIAVLPKSFFSFTLSDFRADRFLKREAIDSLPDISI